MLAHTLLLLCALQASPGARLEAPGPPQPLNLNQATAEELVRLPQIGPKRAEAILKLRARRPFKRLRELRRVRGIGAKTLRRLRPYLKIGPAAPPNTKMKPPPSQSEHLPSQSTHKPSPSKDAASTPKPPTSTESRKGS